MSTRILTTHVGSLPRPDAIIHFHRAKANNEHPDQAAFFKILQCAVHDVVAKQVELGIDIVSDGEFSKETYATYVIERWHGFGGSYPSYIARDIQPFPSLVKKFSPPKPQRPGCIGPISLKSSGLLEQDVANLKAATVAVKPSGAFINAASPGLVAYFLRNHHYANFEDYLAALIPLLRAEYLAILDAGFEVQLDCPELAMGRHIGYAEDSDDEFWRKTEASIDALNAATDGLPKARMRMHICWGNYAGPHHFDLPLAKVLKTALRANPAKISFEGANPRHQHEYAVFEDFSLPDDKVLLPGVIDSTTNFIEHPELVAQRIRRYTRIVGPERVIASSDCGFSTSAYGGDVDPAVVWLKLHALVAGARLASNGS